GERFPKIQHKKPLRQSLVAFTISVRKLIPAWDRLISLKSRRNPETRDCNLENSCNFTGWKSI
ncbi:MAG: hypothetical protein O9353_03790, partial [Bacteroidia bacterium]|nr:hypothetical protein [Bacteroidia bacterium]